MSPSGQHPEHLLIMVRPGQWEESIRSIDQSEASTEVTWSSLTNQRPVLPDSRHSRTSGLGFTLKTRGRGHRQVRPGLEILVTLILVTTLKSQEFFWNLFSIEELTRRKTSFSAAERAVDLVWRNLKSQRGNRWIETKHLSRQKSKCIRKWQINDTEWVGSEEKRKGQKQV